MIPQRAETNNNPAPKYGSVSIGGKTYKTVKIGKQEWLAENLDLATDSSYKNPSHPKYGRYYEWNALKEVQAALPSGWRVPDNKDWNNLMHSVGGANVAGRALKSTEFGGDDEYGFSVLPAGGRDTDGSFARAGDIAIFWSSSMYRNSDAYYWYFYSSDDSVGHSYDYESIGLSVRCVRDSNEPDEPKGEGHQSTRPRIRFIK